MCTMCRMLTIFLITVFFPLQRQKGPPGPVGPLGDPGPLVGAIKILITVGVHVMYKGIMYSLPVSIGK